MGTEIHWVEGPWAGKLAVAPRPRGGDWLQDELASWRQAGLDAILSLLTPQEENDLDLRDEEEAAKSAGMRFLSLPIPDRHVPGSETELTATLEQLDAILRSGKNIVVHCRQGIGRTGLVAACLLMSRGLNPDAAIRKVATARGIDVPETPEQLQWIHHYANVSAGAK